MTRAILDTGSPCRHFGDGPHCPLCGTAAVGGWLDAARSVPEVDSAIAAARAGGATVLVLRGGDLLQRPEALDILARTAGPGRADIEVWTAGRALARPGAADAVRAAGATRVAVVLYGDTAAAHDWVAGQAGAFQQALAALKRARAAGLGTTVLAAVVRPTYRQLGGLVQKALALQVDGFRFVRVDAPDRARHPLAAPPALAGPWVADAVKKAGAARRRVAIEGLPACVLGAAAPHIDAEPAGSGEFGRPCEACTWRPRCPGMPPCAAGAHGWTGVEGRTDAAH